MPAWRNQNSTSFRQTEPLYSCAPDFIYIQPQFEESRAIGLNHLAPEVRDMEEALTFRAGFRLRDR
jgi:hypothetical protein